METPELLTNRAQETEEEACQPQATALPEEDQTTNKKASVTFAEATQSSEICASQASSAYKEALSQPAANMTHRQRMLWLQRRREVGLWVQCDDCDKWRFLPHVLDNHELPNKWLCRMNTGTSEADCSIPEVSLRVREEEDLVHSEYSAGSVVWARLAEWPWWPAMVADCPDTEQYYWLDGFSDIPTHYNVVFFDAHDVTRAWIAPEHMKPYTANKKKINNVNEKRYKKRLDAAVQQADDAERLTLAERLSKYSFLARYPGSINSPKHLTRKEIQKFQNKLKRKYNLDFPEKNSSEDEEDRTKEKNILIDKNKEEKAKKSRINEDNDSDMVKALTKMQDSLFALGDSYTHDTKMENRTDKPATEVLKLPNEPDSLKFQVASIGTVSSTVKDLTEAIDDDTSNTYVPGDENETNSILTALARKIRESPPSPKSDDFDF